MKSYQITQTVNGLVIGTYIGEDEAQALDAMAQDQGYADYDALLNVTGETRDTDTLDIREV